VLPINIGVTAVKSTSWYITGIVSRWGEGNRPRAYFVRRGNCIYYVNLVIQWAFLQSAN
jgi:hypothetical protein